MTDLTEAKRLVEAATPGPWIVQDGCSWRRIGTHEHDGDVLQPTVHPRDGHLDLIARDGKTYDNLRLIAWAGTHLPTLLAEHEAALAQNEALREGLRDIYWNMASATEAKEIARAILGDRG